METFTWIEREGVLPSVASPAFNPDAAPPTLMPVKLSHAPPRGAYVFQKGLTSTKRL